MDSDTVSVIFHNSFEPGARMLLFHEINQSRVVLAHERLVVLAGYIVPFHAVAVEVVEDGQARLVILALKCVEK